MALCCISIKLSESAVYAIRIQPCLPYHCYSSPYWLSRIYYLLIPLIGCLAYTTSSPPLAPSQPHRLSVFLQLRNQPVSLLDYVCILLVLVVRPVRFYDLVHAVDGAGYAVCGDEFG